MSVRLHMNVYVNITRNFICSSPHVLVVHYHIPVTKMFGSKFLECALLKYLRNWGIWSGVPPPPHPMKIWSGLGTLDLSWSGVHLPPPWKWKSSQGTWHLGFELVWSPPSPMKIWSGLGTLDLSSSGVPFCLWFTWFFITSYIKGIEELCHHNWRGRHTIAKPI